MKLPVFPSIFHPFVLAFVLSGCMATTNEIATIDIGAAPEAEKAEEIVLYHLSRTLKDPDSMKAFRIISDVKRGQLNYGAFSKGPSGKTFGNPMWYVCAEYNAKNSFGAYVGLKTYAFFIHDNMVERSFEGVTDGDADFGSTKFSCL